MSCCAPPPTWLLPLELLLLSLLQNKLILAYVLTALAILIPYSGLITTPVALAYFKYMSMKPAPKVVPAVV